MASLQLLLSITQLEDDVETIKRVMKLEACALLALLFSVTAFAAANILYRAAYQPYKLMWREMLEPWCLCFAVGAPFAMFVGAPVYMLLSRRIGSRVLSVTIAVVMTIVTAIAGLYFLTFMGQSEGC